MNRRDDDGFESRVADWLEDDPLHAPPAVLETVLAAFPSIPQRRRGLIPLGWRTTPMSMPVKLALSVAAVVAVLVAGGLVLNRPPGPDVGASPTPSVPTTTPAAQPSASRAFSDAVPLGGPRDYPPGWYSTDLLQPAMAFEISDPDWIVVYHDAATMRLSELGRDRHVQLSQPAEVIDPTTGDPGPVPADFAGWLERHPGLTIEAAADDIVGGLAVRRLDGTPSPDATFDANGYVVLTRTPAGIRFEVRSDQRFRIYVLDSAERPLLLMIVARADVFAEFEPVAQRFIDSVVFEE